MPIIVELFDGTRLQFPDDTSKDVIDRVARQKTRELQGIKPESGGIAALKANFQNLIGAGAALAGRVGLRDVEEAQRAYEARKQRAEEIFQPNPEGWNAPVNKLLELAGGSLPYMAAPLAAGAAAAFAPVSGVAATALGLGAAGLTSAGQFTATNLARQLEEGKQLRDTDLTAATTAAVPQALLDTIALRMMPGVGRIFGEAGIKVTKENAEAIAKQALSTTLKDYAVTTGKTMTREGVTEAGQQALERLQAGLNITDPQARAEYFESFIGGAVLGGVVSPAGRFFERGSEQRQARGILDKQAQEAQAERLKQEEAEKQKPEYIAKLASDYEALAQQKETLKAQIVKGTKEAPISREDADRNAIIDKQLKELEPQLKAAKNAYINAGGPDAARKARDSIRIQEMTPEEFAEYSYEQKLAKGQYKPTARTETEEQLSQDFGDVLAPPAPGIEESYLVRQINLARSLDQGNFDVADYAAFLMEMPGLAKRIVERQLPIPGFSPEESTAILEGLKLQLTDLGEQISTGRETAGYERTQANIEQQAAREAAALEQQRATLRQQQAEEAQIEREGMQAYAQRLAGRTQDRELGEATARMAGAEQLTPTMRLEQPGVTRVTEKGKTTTTVDQTARPEFTETLEPDRRVPPSPIKAINATLDQLQSATQVDDSTKELAARVQANLNPVLRQMYAQSQEETQRQQRLLSERGIAPPKPLVPESPLATLYSWARSAATGNPAPDLSARVEAALQSLAQGQVSETQPLLQPGRRELTAEERGALAGTKAESRRKTAAFMPSGEMRQGVQLEIPLPEPTAKAFDSFSKFNDFLASDALQAYRMQQGLTFPTISSLLRTLSPIQTRISELQQQVNQLNSQRKAVLTASADKKQSAEAQVKALEAQISKTLADFDTSVKGAYVAGMSKRMQKKYAPEAQGLLFGDVRTTVDAQGMAKWGEGRAAPVVTSRVDPNRIANWGAADSPIAEATQRYREALAHKQNLDALLLQAVDKLSAADKERGTTEITARRLDALREITAEKVPIQRGKVTAYEAVQKAEENLRAKALAIIEANKALDAAVGTDKEKAARARAKQAKEEGVRAHFALMQAHKRVPTTEQLNDNFIKFLNAKTQLDEQLREAKKRLSGFKLALNSAKTRLNNVQVSVAESNPEVRARLDGLVNGLLNAERQLDAALRETPAAQRTAAELERQAAPLEQSKEALERMVSGQLEEASQRAESRRKVEPEETPAERSVRESKEEQARLERVADMPGRAEVSFEPRRAKIRRILSEGAMAKVQARIKEITKLLSDEARAIYEEEKAARKGTTTEYKSLEPAERAKLIQELRALYKQQEAAIAASRQRYSEEKGAKVAAVDDEIEARKIEIAALEAERDSLMANAQLNKTEKKQVAAGKKTEEELLEARRAKIKAAKDGGNKGIVNKKAILERLITAQAARKEELAKQAPGAKITPIPSRKERADTADKLRRELEDRKDVTVNDLQYLDAAEAASLLREESPTVIAGMLQKIGDPKASEILDKFAANVRNAVNASIEGKTAETDADTLNAALERLLTGKAARRAIGPVTRPEVFPPREMRTGSEESRAGATTTGSTNKLQEVRGAKQRDVPITKGEQQQANVDAAKLIDDITTTRNALKNVDERLELIAKNPVPETASDERKQKQADAKKRAEADKETLVAKLTDLLEKQAVLETTTAKEKAAVEKELAASEKEVSKVGKAAPATKAQKAQAELEAAEEPEVEVEAFPTEGKYLFQLNDNQFSRGPTADPSSVASLRAELGKVFPDLGRVQMYESVEALIAANPQYKGRIPADARGFVDSAGNKAFLIAENINKGQALSVLLHEVGAHVGLKNTLGDAQYNALVNAVKAWEKRNDGSTEAKVAQAARRKVEAAETEAGHVNDELLAYAIEEAVNADVKPFETKGPLGQWLTRIAQAFRKVLEKFGLPPKALDAQALVDMAFGAAKMEMRGELKQASGKSGDLLFTKVVDLAARRESAVKKDSAELVQQNETARIFNINAQLKERIVALEEKREALEDEADYAEAAQIENTIRKEIKDAYERTIKSLWPKIQLANKTLETTKYFGSLEAGELQRLIDNFQEEYIDRYSKLQDTANNNFNEKPLRRLMEDVLPKELTEFDRLIKLLTPSKKIKKSVDETGEIKFSRNLSNAARVANEIVGRQKSWSERLRDNYLGMGFRAQYIDKFAPVEAALKKSLGAVSTKAIQAMYYLRMYDQRMHFTSQAIIEGAPQRVEKLRKDGTREFLIESKPGANISQIVDILKRKDVVKAAGSPDAANKLFTLYLAKLRADNVGYGKLNFETKKDDIVSAFNEIEADPTLRAAFAEARDIYNQYNRNLLEFGVQSGAISRAIADKWIAEKDYVPYYRVQDGVVTLNIGEQTPIRIGNLKDSPHLKELVGGKEAVFDFLTSSVMNTTMLIDMSMHNLAMKNLMHELRDVGLAKISKETPKHRAPEGAVTFKIDGVDHFAIVDTEAVGIDSELLVKGLAGIPTMLPTFVRTMGVPSRILRRLVVASPVYMARQLVRDSTSAALASGANMIPVIDALRQIGKTNILQSRGITGGQVFTGMPEDMTRILKDMQAGKISLSNGLAWLEAKAAQADALTRQAQYDSYIAQGLSEMEATMMALESMNFSRRGLSPGLHMVSTLIPFFNAQIQGLDVLYRSFTGQMPMNEKLDIQRKLITRGMMLFGMSMLYAAMMQDDEAYKNAKPEEKYGNWFVPLPGTDQKLRVPIPFELGYIFKALPEALVNIMSNEEGGEEALKALKHIVQQTVPGMSSYFMPQAVKPLYEVVTGTSMYTGRSLESGREQQAEPGYRARESTTEIARWLGENTGFSPIKMEYLVRGYTTGLGVAFLQALSLPMSSTGPERAERRPSDLPVFGTLFQPSDASGIIDATYERMQELARKEKTYERLLEDGRKEDAAKYLQENAGLVGYESLAGRFRQQMGKITDYERRIRASDMTPQEKRQRLEEMRDAKIRLAAAYREAGKTARQASQP